MQALRTSHNVTKPAIAIEDDALVLSEPSRLVNADEWRSDVTGEDEAEPLEEAGYGHGV
jgi:hypothetical protein